MRTRAAALAPVLVVLVMLAAGCGGPGDHAISGEAVVPPSPSLRTATRCTARASEYPDVVEGAQVTIKTDEGTLIGVARLGAPHWSDGACRLPFTIPRVPNAKAYTFEVARQGAQTFARSYLASQHFRLDLVFLPTPR